MRRIALLFIMLSLATFTPVAGAAPRFSFETTEHVRPGDRKVVEEAMQVAMKYVRELPPAQNNPFTAKSDRKVHVVLSTSLDPMAVAQIGLTDSDAFTGTTELGKELVTFIFLLVDRLCWNPETGRQRPDAFVRVLNALGHEIFGNVATQLRLEFGKPPVVSDAERRADEIAAFEAGIAFLERFKASKFQEGIPASHIISALRREKAALKLWKKRNCGYLLGGPGEQHFVD